MIPAPVFLLPCPMCGTAPNGLTRMSGGYGPDLRIGCPACLLKIERFEDSGAPDDSAAQIVEAWNRRAGSATEQATAQPDSLI